MAVGFAAVVDLERTSPGALSSVHERESDLAGKSGCAACHGGWFSNMTDSCLECHADIDTQIEARGGLHGSFDAGLARSCAVCHSEHHGGEFRLVNRLSFIQAGVPRPGEFDHAKIGFDLNGAHLPLDCTACHEHALDPVLEKGTKRFMGLDQDCASCHEDPHEGRMVVACASCHGQSKWDELFSLGHERQLPLVGGHGDVGCRECHAESTAHSLEALGDGANRPAVRTCEGCHESPHARPFITGVAALATMPVDRSCVSCHEAPHESFRDERLTLTAEQHARSGFPIEVPHDQVTCDECHAPEVSDFKARYPGRGADECAACHDDPHGGQFAGSPLAESSCLSCHDRHHFEPHAFTVEKHQLSAFKLTGSHVETDCNACHTIPSDAEPREFHGTAAHCEGCHGDAHDGFFEPFTRSLPTIAEGECARCHATTKFADIPAAGFDHARWTGFPVQGAHAESACDSCHPLAETADATGRTFGRVSQHFGEFEGCVTCHTDPHQGTFDWDDLPSEVAGRADCARCHVESSWRAFPRGFDHGLWTGFMLIGAHGETKCSGCHAQLKRPDALGRTWGRSRGSSCADCHDDPHAGQFAPEGEGGDETDCSRCHTDELKSFSRFNHDRDSVFPLEGAHESVACAACHKTTVEGGVEFVRYRPLKTECVDCHGVHEEVLLRRKPRRN
jgi:hypothetical protein